MIIGVIVDNAVAHNLLTTHTALFLTSLDRKFITMGVLLTYHKYYMQTLSFIPASSTS